MRKITFILLFAFICAPIFGQDVAPTFTWSNKADYQINTDTAATFKPGEEVNYTFDYTLGETGGVANTFDFILIGLQLESPANKDIFGNWANSPAPDATFDYPGPGAGGTVTGTYTVPATSTLSSDAANSDKTYRVLIYLAYNNGSGVVYGGDGASDPTEVLIRSQSEIDVLLSTTNFEKLTSFYPNPANDVIHFGNDVNTESYKIMSLTGALLKEEKATSKNLDVSFLKSGMYFVVTDSGTAKFMKK